jgi:protein O-GlcNAc transferase
MQAAVAAYGAGEWGKAEQLCRGMLDVASDHAGALHLLGVIANRSGHSPAAVDLLARAVAADPHSAAAHISYGNALRSLRRLPEALACYENAARIQPGLPEAHFNRANVLSDLGRKVEAIDSYQRALELRPLYAEAQNNCGNAQRDLGRFAQALESYNQALRIRPDDPLIAFNHGNALEALGRPEEALASYDRAQRLRPDFAEAHSNRASVLTVLGRFDEALAAYDRALVARPNFAGALSNRGNVLRQLGRFDASLESYRQALRLQPGDAEVWYNCGNVLHDLRRLDEALEGYARALALKPDHYETYVNRGNVLKDLRRLPEALESYQQALQIRADHADGHANRGNVLIELRRPAEALESYRRALEIRPDYPWLYGIWLHTRAQLAHWSDRRAEIAGLVERVAAQARATLPLTATLIVDSPALQRQAAEIWVHSACPASAALPPIEQRPRGGRIRVGYYSADFHAHATAFLMAGLIERHQRDEFEVIAFSFGAASEDDMRKRLAAAFDQFIDVRGKSDREVAELSRGLGIDIAVDLKGFTYDQRPGIFAHRAAPVQVSYLGYPGTMGAPYIDYLVADATLIPEETRPHYSEKIVYLPHSYQANDRHRQISEREFSRQELGLPPEGFVFCCFNNTYKITPEGFDIWMRLLREVPGSVLWLLEDDPTAPENLRAEARARGVDGGRLVFATRMPLPEHLARHRAADLFLDTLPCNAHTTASDALWAGLPLLTRLGESFAARVAGTLLNAIGLPELITRTDAEYEAKALELARHPQRLGELRQKLLANRLTTPLFDTELFARHLEDAYRAMVERWQTGLAPEDIRVAARAWSSGATGGARAAAEDPA